MSQSAIGLLAVGLHVAGDALQRRAGQRHVLGTDAELDRDRQPRRRGEVIGERLDRDQRTPPAGLGQGEQAVEIELGRRQHAFELRLASERQLGIAFELHRPVVRPVLKLDLFEHRRRAVAPDLAADAPRFDDQRLRPCGRAADRTRQIQRALEARDAALDPDRSVGLGQQGTVDRIDAEPHAHGAVIAGAAGGDAIGIMLAGQHEGAFALDRSGERPQLALEFQLLEHQTGAARRVGEDGAAVHDVEPLDRKRIRVEADRRRRPVEVSGSVQPEREFRAFDAQIGRPPFAAHQGAERELDAEPARAHGAGVARAGNVDALQRQGRRRQEARVDRAGDAHLQPGELARPRLELAAILVPIDEKRSDQRRHQRQDDRNRKTEQRRLHAVSKAGLLGAAAAGDGARRRTRLGTHHRAR